MAIALGTRAPVLLLDEPLASLDPLARREFLAVLVDEVRSSGATAVLSSHIVTDIQQACDRLVVLSSGRLALDGLVADVRRAHRTVVAGDLDSQTAVGLFIGPAGERLALVKSGDAGLPEPTLEEIVLGYLAAYPSSSNGIPPVQ